MIEKTTNNFSDATIKIQQYLSSHGIKNEIEQLPESTATAQDAATSLSVSINYIGKSIAVLLDESKVGILVLPGDRQVDLEKVKTFFFASNVRLLKAKEVKEFIDMPIGGVSPFGLSANILLAIDESCFETPFIYVAAGHPKAVIKTSAEEIVKITKCSTSKFFLE